MAFWWNVVMAFPDGFILAFSRIRVIILKSTSPTFIHGLYTHHSSQGPPSIDT
jgi:hypothetical protein